jgi:CRISPR system Cascade subunit CasB
MTEKKHPLVENLEKLWTRGDRAALAALRRGLLPEGEAQVYPYVARFFPAKTNTNLEKALVTLATLFALHPGSGGVPLPVALRALRGKSGSIDGRFVALLDSDADDLPEHLRHAISLVRSQGTAIDWSDLFTALLQWGNENRWVQRRWARLYWADNNENDKEPS